MNDKFKVVLISALVSFSLYFIGIGYHDKVTDTINPSSWTEIVPATDSYFSAKAPTGLQRPYVSGPLIAEVGELCVFRLSDPKNRADWVVVRQSDSGPPATCYIDSSGASLAFSSNVPAKYTIIAAVIEDGLPMILMHVCEYGVSPEPSPSPFPAPPTPNPTPPPATLGEWVKQNVPDAGRGECGALAACFEATADAIEKRAVKTPEAAFSTLRTATQAKIQSDVWEKFLDELSVLIREKINDTTDIKSIGVIFAEIASALKSITVSDAESILASTSSICPDPTGKACQIQTSGQNRRNR
ncbi:MAG: hypothetical protein ACRC2T_02475 [Thermoguttaceae bacterium]